jgi:hypothetical protein
MSNVSAADHGSYERPVPAVLDRFEPPVPGRLFPLTDAMREVLRALDRHKRLPTSYLYRFIARSIKYDERYARRILRQLYDGYCEHPEHPKLKPRPHTCKPVTFIKRHWLAYDNAIQAVYGLTDRAKAILSETEPHIANSASPIHDLFSGCGTASFELLAPEFISRGGILAQASCPAETQALTAPFDIQNPHGTITPDDFFCLGFDWGKVSIWWEADRATESGTVIRDKIRHIVAILDDGIHRALFKAPRLVVCIGTTTELNAAKILTCIRETVPTKWQSRFLVQVFPDFGAPYRIPRDPLPVFEPWRSVNGAVKIEEKP